MGFQEGMERDWLLLSDSPWNMQIFCRHSYVGNTDQIVVIIQKQPQIRFELTLYSSQLEEAITGDQFYRELYCN